MNVVTSSDIANTVARFHSPHYLRHNARRLEHLASLGIPIAGMTVLETGAGIGDHSHYYMDRKCRITITEARSVNLHILKQRYPGYDVQFLDMEHPLPIDNSPFDVIHCYGLLYHLSNPEEALEFLSKQCSRMLFLETCVSFGEDKQINLVAENAKSPTQSFSATGCRPTRRMLFERLKELFEHVYIPRTQPNHEEFPVNWAAPEEHHHNLSRAIFIATRAKIDNKILSSTLLDRQQRHD